MRDLFRLDTLSRPALMLVIGRTLGFAAAFAIPIALARVFAPADFGTYKQLFLIFGTLYIVAQLGMAESLYYFVPQRATGAAARAGNALVILGGMGAATFALLTGLRFRIAEWLANPPLAEYLPLLGVALALMITTAAFEIVLVARRRYAAAAWTYALSDLGRALFIVLPVMAFGNVRWVLIGMIGFALCRFVALLVSLWRELGPLTPNLALAREQLAYALPYAVAIFVEVAQANLHQFVVAARFDAVTFAIYAVGCLQIPLVDLIATSTANVMMVKMSAEGAERTGAGALAFWHHTVCRMALVIFPLAAFLVISAREVIVLLFTSTYAASAPIFMLWTLTFLPTVLCIDALLRVHAATRFLLYMNVIRLGVLALLISPFLSTFGLAGAVLVTLASTCIAKAAGLVKIARLLDVPVRAVLPWRRLAIIGACAAAPALPVWWLAQHWLDQPAAILLWGLVYASTYALLCWASAGRHDAGVAHSLHTSRLAAWLAEE
jgi:O-antigen/teichoic acid export membrane protein